MGRTRGGQGLWCNLRFWKDVGVSFGRYQSSEAVREHGCFWYRDGSGEEARV